MVRYEVAYRSTPDGTWQRASFTKRLALLAFLKWHRVDHPDAVFRVVEEEA